jgi:hypothetical protein
LRRRVNPRAASDGGAWRRRAATVSVTQKPSNTVSVLRCSWFYFGASFCKFKSFNVLFRLIWMLSIL